MRIAMITGASSGLGREFVYHADRSASFDEIWVIARRAERLDELVASCTTKIRPIVADLSEKESIKELARLLEEQHDVQLQKGEGFSVGLLVNAAGFAKFGTFRDMTPEENESMIDVNCRALVDVTQLTLGYMGKGSRIIEVASCAGFQPLPGLNVYAATKAFVIAYTRALRWELGPHGIHVTALCPVWMKTEFAQVARDTANGRSVKHTFPTISPRRAASWSSVVCACDLPIATCSIFTLAHRIIAKFIPNPIVMAAWEGIRRI